MRIGGHEFNTRYWERPTHPSDASVGTPRTCEAIAFPFVVDVPHSERMVGDASAECGMPLLKSLG